MRTCFAFVFASLALSYAAAQTAATTYTPDINGNQVSGVAATSVNGVTTDLRQSVNGRQVPLEQVEEKVLSKSGPTIVTERIIRHYGANGQVVSTERVVKEETQIAAGESTVRATTYRSDISGNMAEAERKTIDTHKAGAATVTETAVEKKSLNGSFEVSEKRMATSEPLPDGKRESESVFLRSANGDLYEAQRVATTEKDAGNQIVRNTAIYEPALNGNMSLTRQQVDKTTTNPDGSSSQELETFGRASDGRARPADAPPALTEKRTIERQKIAGAVVETQTVQLPSISDPGRLDPARKVSETVCRGECSNKP